MSVEKLNPVGSLSCVSGRTDGSETNFSTDIELFCNKKAKFLVLCLTNAPICGIITMSIGVELRVFSPSTDIVRFLLCGQDSLCVFHFFLILSVHIWTRRAQKCARLFYPPTVPLKLPLDAALFPRGHPAHSAAGCHPSSRTHRGRLVLLESSM